MLTRWERAVHDDLVRFFNRQEKVTLQKLTGAKARRGTRHWDPPIEGKGIDPVRVFDLDRWRDEAAELGETWVVGIFEEFGESTLESIEAAGPKADPRVGTPFNLRDPQVAAEILARQSRIRDTTETTWAAIQAAMADGDAAGEDTDQIAGRIRDVFSAARGIRARVIARTEVISAANSASLHAARQSGVVEKKTWLAAVDHRTRPDHVNADGQTVPMDQKFTVGGESLAYPGDPAGSAGNVINCRCTLLYERTPTSPTSEPATDPDVTPAPTSTQVDPIGRPDADDLVPSTGADLASPSSFVGDVRASGKVLGPGARTTKAVRTAMDAIDQVHASPASLTDLLEDGAQMTVKQTSGDQTLGVYRFVNSDGRPVEFGLSTGGPAEAQAFNMTHEFGHFFDHQDFGNAGTFSTFSPTDRAVWDEFWDVIDGTDSIQHLARMRNPSDVAYRTFEIEIDGRTVNFRPPANHLRYLADRREIFARAYSQWIAHETQNPILRAGLDAMRGNPIDRALRSQWDDDEFEDVARAFRKLFRHYGLID